MLSHFDILKRLIDGKVVAVVRLASGDHLVKVAEALKSGGITAIEFTIPTPNSLEMIKQASAQLGDSVIMGAGTVLDPETARAAILSGAQFIVTPALNLKTIELCQRYGKPVIPGALTPTEILTAWEAGADMVKVFPADSMGPSYIKAVLAPLPQVRLVPTGGVSADNAAQYIQAGATALGVGGKLVDQQAVSRGDWSVLTMEAERLMSAVQQKDQQPQFA